MNVLLAKTDHLTSSFRKMVSEYGSYFKDKQGAFKGEKKTYVPKSDSVDLPNERAFTRVVTTVDEKLNYFVDTSKEYIDALFSQEATNASGAPKAKLVVEDVDFGTYSALELLRLKSLLENGDFDTMYSNIPVRSDAETWIPTKEEEYAGRQIFESQLTNGTKKSIEKESYILSDPNIGKVPGANYTPQIAQKNTVIELGDFTYQRFSGEYVHSQRANILKRRTKLLTAVIEALKTANDVEAIESEMNSEKLFGYLHTGKIVK